MSSLILQLAFGAAVVVGQGEGGGAVAFHAGGEGVQKGQGGNAHRVVKADLLRLHRHVKEALLSRVAVLQK
ncbi:hypothetical protein ACFU9Y_00615 [Streptomyces sp. NPDC057621]|uniref:hypothetical protein n=1 Tax=Streptomyces sp. NPDC057621 TaxID=3346186 RepID=UPI0036AD77A9